HHRPLEKVGDILAPCRALPVMSNWKHAPRAKLSARRAPYFLKVAKGLRLGYYRGTGCGCGTWIGRRYLGNKQYETGASTRRPKVILFYPYLTSWLALPMRRSKHANIKVLGIAHLIFSVTPLQIP